MVTVLKDKLKLALQAAHTLEKHFGKGAIIHMADFQIEPAEAIPTGSLGLDTALGIGGFPRGRIVEIFGPESSGKTTLALHTVAECQKLGGVAAFVDAEHALDMTYARTLGVREDQLFVSQPDSGEQALEVVDTLVKSGGVDVIVVDSVAALTPRAELEGEMGDAHMGLQARMMSQALRKLTAIAAREKTLIIFLNQLRQKIGVVYGNPETTTGGNALKFYASVRIDVRRGSNITENERNIGHRSRFKVVKNKCAPPFCVAEADVLFGKGISRSGELLDLACERGVVQKAGAWFSYGDRRLGQGREKVRDLIESEPALFEEIRRKVMTGPAAPVSTNKEAA